MADNDVGGNFSSAGLDSGVSPFTGGLDANEELMESSDQGNETGDTELISNEKDQELYNPGYDSNEFGIEK